MKNPNIIHMNNLTSIRKVSIFMYSSFITMINFSSYREFLPCMLTISMHKHQLTLSLTTLLPCVRL